MELRAAPAVAAIARRIAAYLARLPVDAATRQRLAAAADDADPARALAGLHGALAADGGEAAARSGAPTPSDAVQSGSRGFTRAGSGDAASATRRSQRRRLELGYGTGVDAASPPRLQCAPPLNRSPMAPRQWSAADGAAADPGSARGRNMRRRRGALRRALLLAVVLGQTYLATSLMSAVLPYHGREPLEVAVLLLYAVLFFWISAGFWTAVCGFVVQLRGGDAHAISRSAAADAPLGDGRTAVVMPICSEDVARVFAGLRATCASVAARGELDRFDFYVLSDSADADTRVAELHAWRTLCREPELAGHVFYRWRRHRIKRKSGNVADFCRRWGRNYRYLVVLDADSVMSGDCLLRLVQLMEANPAAGIIQTAPVAAGRDTFYARMQQFATRVYGPLFTAGLHYWQLGESHYWGHNAILRVAPFTRHCALARLPGNGALSGEILSHDFVEAALMRRAGWEVWLAYDLAGSYEEMPPNLIDELKRDRRWCHGNLMNARLFAARGLHPAHRAVFFTGVMAYLSSLLWFAFLLLSTALLAQHTLAEPQYFVAPNQLFPLWPEWRPQWAISLFGATATLLLLPKLLAVALRVVRGARDFGGAARLTTAMLLELLLSAVLAPIRMLFHAQFVAAALLGMRIRWKSPPRDDSETGWLEACRRHGPHTVFGLAWAGFVYWLNPAFLWWLAPVVGAIALSIPISVLSSRVGWGRGLRHAGLFLIPEEVRPPAELRATAAHVAATPPSPGFVDAVVDPAVNALLCAAARPRPNGDGARSAARAARALATGPDGLDSGARAALLDDPEALALLHFQVWSAPAPHPGWLAAMGETGADFFPTPSGADDAQTPLPARQRGPGRRRAAPAA